MLLAKRPQKVESQQGKQNKTAPSPPLSGQGMDPPLDPPVISNYNMNAS